MKKLLFFVLLAGIVVNATQLHVDWVAFDPVRTPTPVQYFFQAQVTNTGTTIINPDPAPTEWFSDAYIWNHNPPYAFDNQPIPKLGAHESAIINFTVYTGSPRAWNGEVGIHVGGYPAQEITLFDNWFEYKGLGTTGPLNPISKPSFAISSPSPKPEAQIPILAPTSTPIPSVKTPQPQATTVAITPVPPIATPTMPANPEPKSFFDTLFSVISGFFNGIGKMFG